MAQSGKIHIYCVDGSKFEGRVLAWSPSASGVLILWEPQQTKDLYTPEVISDEDDKEYPIEIVYYLPPNSQWIPMHRITNIEFIADEHVEESKSNRIQAYNDAQIPYPRNS